MLDGSGGVALFWWQAMTLTINEGSD